MRQSCWIRVGAVCIMLGFVLTAAVGVSAQDIQGSLQGLPAPWTIETIDDGHVFEELGQHSLAYDSTGNPHIAYGGDHLYHAYRAAGNWVTEVVDSSNRVGKNASIAIDSANHIYITYYDEVNKDLKYATNWQGWWESFTIASNGDVGAKSRIFASWDGQGPELTISYLDSTALKVWLRYSDINSYYALTPAEVVSGTLSATNFAMAMRGAQPHFSIYANGGIYYGYFSISTWVQEPVCSSGCLSPTDIAFDSTGTPYIPIIDFIEINSYLTYLSYRDNGVWKAPSQPDPSTLIFFGTPIPQAVSMQYDPDLNKIFFAMQLKSSETTSDLIIMRGLKNIETEKKIYPDLLTNVPGDRFPAIAIANSQILKAGVVYLYGSKLQYQFLSTLNDTAWNTNILDADTSSDKGGCSVVRVDKTGRLRLMYRQSHDGALIYRTSTASGWSSPITITAADEWAVCSQFERPGMDLLADGTPVISYKNLANELKVAWWDCPPNIRCSFSRQLVDSGLSQGGAAIAVGPYDSLNILYNKAFHLKMAQKTSLTDLAWIITAVDDNRMTEDTPSLDVDTSGKLHAAYVDFSDRPWYTRYGFGGAVWSAFFQFEPITNTLNPVQGVVNPLTDLPQAAYIKEPNKLVLRIYSCVLLNCSWGPSPIDIDTPADTNNGSLNEASFAVDSAGKGYFSYAYQSPAHGQNGLKLMVRNGANLSPYLIQNGVTIDETSVALMSGNVPVIAYHIPSLGQIRIARGSYGVFLPLIKR